MHRIRFTFLFCFLSFSLLAQHRSQIEVSPFGTVAGRLAKLRIRYQYNLPSRFSPGVDFRYFFTPTYPGWQVAPYLSYATLQSENARLYISAGYYYAENSGIDVNNSRVFSSRGFGGAIGVQAYLDHPHRWLIDLGFGVRRIWTDPALDTENGPDDLQHYLNIGPATFGESTFMIGFAF